MKTIKLTVAQALLRFLDNQYISIDGEETKFVEGVMGIFGHGNVVGLGEALAQYKDEIKFIQGKNEQDIANVCIAFAKQNKRRKIYACTSSIGPGALNMVTPAGTATVNKIPILLLPGDSYADRQPDPVLQQMEKEDDYTVSVNDAFKPVSKYWDRISRPEMLMSACLNAMRILTDPAQTGAATICLPQDVQGESYNYPVEFLRKRIWFIDRGEPAKESIRRAVELLKTKKNPVIIAGGGVRYSAAGKELLEFAKEFNIPFCETQAGKGEISFDEKYNLGCVGVCGTLCANRITRDADAVIAIGTKLNDFVTASKSAFKKYIPMIAINTNTMDSLKMDSVSVIADAKVGIEALRDSLRNEGYRASYTDEIELAKNEWSKELDRMKNLEDISGLNQSKVILKLNEWFDKTDVVVSASGSLPSDLERLWQPKSKDTYHLEYGFSCMGYEVSGALGAKIANMDKEVYCFVGDGGFLMAHSDLATSLQENIKINILLFNNFGHQCIHNLQKNQGVGSFGTEFKYRENSGQLSGSYTNIDFAGIAKSYGANSWKVTNLDELKIALEESKKSEKTTLIEISVLPGTMTEGYEAFWRVGLASTSEIDSVTVCYKELEKKVATLRKW